ncbi:hypothetical protein ACHAXT_002218 [Thalassiosira profunda]
MRFDLAFFLCCCRSFLSSAGRDEDESFYDLLGVDPSATPEELKRAYKRQSLLMHPDKLAQKGQAVTPADRDRFTRMRHAYEVLSDPRRKETYDAIGERGMKWVEEPLSVDPQELAHNFATSSILDRSKIFAIFLFIYVAVFVLPIVVCLMADGTLGEGAKWVSVLTPLWVWDVFILFYHSRVIFMGPIKRPDHIPEEEWIDPLPMWKRVTAMVRFGCLVLFQVMLALQLDGYIALLWSVVFIPLYMWEAIALRRKVIIANVSIVTHDELELAIGKQFSDLSPAEKEDVHRRYIVVPAKTGATYDAACRLRDDAKMDIVRILARVIFSVLLVVNLDLGLDWSWWLVFIPIFLLVLCIVGSAFRGFSRTQAEAVKRDPAMFGLDPTSEESGAYANMDEPLTDEEREELKSAVAQSAYRAAGTCASQCFFVVLLCIFIAKIEGADYSYLLIISPFLAAGGVVLCCLCCTIFCISEVDENAGMVEFDTAVNRAASGYGATESDGAGSNRYKPPTTQQGNESDGGAAESEVGMTSSETKPPPMSTWDPERGELWQNATADEGETAAETEGQGTPTAAAATDEEQPKTVEPNPSITSVTSSQCDLD